MRPQAPRSRLTARLSGQSLKTKTNPLLHYWPWGPRNSVRFRVSICLLVSFFCFSHLASPPWFAYWSGFSLSSELVQIQSQGHTSPLLPTWTPSPPCPPWDGPSLLHL